MAMTFSSVRRVSGGGSLGSLRSDCFKPTVASLVPLVRERWLLFGEGLAARCLATTSRSSSPSMRT